MKRLQIAFSILVLTLCISFPAQASEWSKKEGYFPRIGAKFLFGLKYTLLSFSTPWLESNEPEYQREWEGFCAGIGKMMVFEAAGLIQLVTFPIPVDFPDVGIGLHIPTRDCPMRHDPKWKPVAKDPQKNLALVPPPKKKPNFAAPAGTEEEVPAPPASIPAVQPPLIVEAKTPPTPLPTKSTAPAVTPSLAPKKPAQAVPSSAQK